MIKSFLKAQITSNFELIPTQEQEIVIEKISDFLLSKTADGIFMLNGFAGTGKTRLVGSLVKTLDQLKIKTILMAPTGRASKVFASYANHPAFTIHKKIYRQNDMNAEGGKFSLNNNLHKNTIFIVDEASMIANDEGADSHFGTGRLMDDLIQYVYSGEGCRLILVGDRAQLPPIGEEESCALNSDFISGYGLEVQACSMTEVVRQASDSGILYNATQIRERIEADDYFDLPKMKIKGFCDIMTVPGNELIETLEQCYRAEGTDETIVVTRSNKRANIYNNGIRSQILWREDELEAGDRIMVTKNNYYWTEKEKNKEIDFLANGQICVVQRVSNVRELYGFRFADVTLYIPEYNDYELQATVLLNTLHAEASSLTRQESEQLFQEVMNDYADIPHKAERLKKLKQDPYFNALQVKYAYAITCHKAQGGQWKNVFVDQGYLSEEYLSPSYFRWLYTALTRSTGMLYLVNYPSAQTI